MKKLKKALEENLEKDMEKVPKESELRQMHEFSSEFLLGMRRLFNHEKKQRSEKSMRTKQFYAVCGMAACFLLVIIGSNIGLFGRDMGTSDKQFSTSKYNNITNENGSVKEEWSDTDSSDGELEAEKSYEEIEEDIGSGANQAVSKDNLDSDNITANENKQNQNAQKLIKTVELSVETRQFDSLVKTLNTKISALEGYIENSELYGNEEVGSTRRLTMTIRIPAEQLENFMGVIGENANVLRTTEMTKDVTLEYVDTESHIKALKTEQETLLKLLEDAKDLEAVLRLQDKLTEVRYELENYESRLKMYDNRIAYSTIEIGIIEVEKETTKKPLSFIEEIQTKLGDNLYDIGEKARDFTIWFVSSIPYFVIWAVVIGIGVIIIRKLLKRRK